ncbi:MAG TPA: hypothetical protein VFE16_10025 [Candidatus Cybelea sp.]|jgi:hypothetical protein|nr:hypothetical protein [Candidatus Cybelea sp.]
MNTHTRSVLVAATLVTVAAWFASGLCASARGVTLIQESNGTVKTYSDVYMSVVGQTLTLRSADGKGTMRIATGACSFDKNVQRCLPYSVTLTQAGKTHTIMLSYGTVFMNLTNQSHELPRSSDMLAPRTVLVLFKTAHGTYVTVKGTLDQVKT